METTPTSWLGYCTKCVLGVYVVLSCLGTTLASEYFADNGVQQTMTLDHIPGRARDDMQQEVLTLLGLHQRPKPSSHTKDNSAPQFMIDLYNTLNAETGAGVVDQDDFHSKINVTLGKTAQDLNGTDVIMSFVNHASKKPHLRHDKDRTFFFDTRDVSPQETVTSAELRLYKQLPRKSRGGDCLLEIFMIVQGADPEDKTLEVESNTTVAWNHEGWIIMNVTHAVYLWTGLPYTNLGLYLRITDLKKNRYIDPDKFGIVGRKGLEKQQPFMVAFFKMAQVLHVRKTRAARKRENSSPKEEENYYHWGGYSYSMDRYRHRACQRHTMYVSFRSLGWKDWIIAPEGYSAFYCGGECSFPLQAHMNATNHALVQTLAHLMKPYDVPKPCCTPTKLSGLQFLYFDDISNVVLKWYKEMVVRACGCH